ncbi:hypothetical protein [Nitratireductor indicus]|nr:hypothetical protein [Nitratireductor indicus]SFQ10569.1 hypothetical protein SAMN05216176_101368 [Nitratireductor indicus]
MLWTDFLPMLALGAACAFLLGLAVTALDWIQARRQPKSRGPFDVR